jgi:2-oxoacid:acceptor oxidoreductase delta subunit (pyruvate/2-ketoisovalerate family)
MQPSILIPLVSEPGNTASRDMTSWRTLRPVIEREKCTNCLICWIFCPEPAIFRNSLGQVEIDYMHCKGCGICAEECPRKAIRLVLEHE